MAKKAKKKTSKKAAATRARRKSTPRGTGKAPKAAREAKKRARVSRARKPTTLPAASLAALQRLAAAGELDSKKASDLDYKLLQAADKLLGDDYDRLSELPEAPAAFWAAWWLEGEVNNGGFHQFFLNKGPVVAATALAFHRRNGPKDVAAMLERAVKALPSGRLPRNHQEMLDVVVPDDPDEDERLMAALGAIDDEFFDRNGPSLMETRLRYVLKRPEDFFN